MSRSTKIRLFQAIMWFLLVIVMAIVWPEGSPSQMIDMAGDVSRAEVVSRW